MKYILFISVFLLSLLNHTPYVYIPAIFMIVLYACTVTNFFKSSKGEVLSCLSYALFIIGSAVYFLTVTVDKSEASIKAFNNNLLFSVLLFFIVFPVYRICKSGKGIRDLKFAISAVLFLHVAVFLSQTIIVYTTGYYLDFIAPITGEESRYENYILGGALSGILRYRATGFYVEPSTYASAITCLIMGATALKVNKKIIYVALLSLLLNFSTIGIILFVLVSIALFVRKIKIAYIFAAIIILLIILAMYNDVVFQFIDDFMYKVDATSGSRYKLIDYIYFDKYGNFNFFGAGFYNIPSELYAKISYGDYSVAALNDAGLINFIFLKFGVFALLPVTYLFYRTKGITLKLLFVCVFISKISFLFPILYLAIVPTLVVSKEKLNG
ncbi:TPA: hypothetical protein ACSTJE_004534 [Serratia fonticola]